MEKRKFKWYEIVFIVAMVLVVIAAITIPLTLLVKPTPLVYLTPSVTAPVSPILSVTFWASQSVQNQQKLG